MKRSDIKQNNAYVCKDGQFWVVADMQQTVKPDYNGRRYSYRQNLLAVSQHAEQRNFTKRSFARFAVSHHRSINIV